MSTDDADVRRATEPTLARTIIEEREGYPAHDPQSEGEGDHGLLRIGFHDADEDLKRISWEQFAAEFEEKELALLYAEDGSTVGDGERLRLVQRDAEER